MDAGRKEPPQDIGISAALEAAYGLSIWTLFWAVVWMIGPLVACTYCLLTGKLVGSPAARLIAVTMLATAVSGLAALASVVIGCRSKALQTLRIERPFRLPWPVRQAVCVLQPVCSVNVVFWIFRVTRCSQPLDDVPNVPGFPFALGFVNNVVFYGIMFMGAAIALGSPWLLSRAAITELIDRLETSTKVDWDEFMVEVHQLDKQLEELWSPAGAGMPWICALVAAVMYALAGAELLLAGDSSAFAMGCVWLFGGSLLVVALLLAMSVITALCQSMTASACSLPAAAQRFLAREGARGKCMLTEMSFEDRQAHARCMNYLTRNSMGVEICGVLVTSTMATSLAVQASIAVPTIYQVLVRVLRDPSVELKEG